MKKILMLTAAGLMFQAAPTLAGHHEGGHMKKGDKAQEMFKAADADGDSSISKAEYLAHVEAKAIEKFEKKDANGDGSISQDESKAYMEAKRGEMKEKMGERREKMKEKLKEKRAERTDADLSHDAAE